MRIPSRNSLVALVIEALPRVGPFRLEQGPRAFDGARRAAREALSRQADPIVSVGARLDAE
jgi:NTE family protein